MTAEYQWREKRTSIPTSPRRPSRKISPSSIPTFLPSSTAKAWPHTGLSVPIKEGRSPLPRCHKAWAIATPKPFGRCSGAPRATRRRNTGWFIVGIFSSNLVCMANSDWPQHYNTIILKRKDFLFKIWRPTTTGALQRIPFTSIKSRSSELFCHVNK